MMKVCKKCGEFKNYSEYYNQKNYADRLDPMCKTCRNITSKEYAEANKARLQEYRKEWHQKNIQREKEKDRIYYQNNKEKYRGYYTKRRQEKKKTKMNNFEDFKKQISELYKEKFGYDLIITSSEPTAEPFAVETELNGKKFLTFSLQVMQDNWRNINLILETPFVEYVANTLHKKQIENCNYN